MESTDWNLAAEKAAIRVHEGNPDMLIIVGGIFTGGLLSPAAIKPIQIPDQVKNDYKPLNRRQIVKISKKDQNFQKISTKLGLGLK